MGRYGHANVTRLMMGGRTCSRSKQEMAGSGRPAQSIYFVNRTTSSHHQFIIRSVFLPKLLFPLEKKIFVLIRFSQISFVVLKLEASHFLYYKCMNLPNEIYRQLSFFFILLGMCQCSVFYCICQLFP